MVVSLNLPKKRVIVTKAQVWKRVLAFCIDVLVIDFLFLPSFSKYFFDPSWTFMSVVKQEILLPQGFMLALIFVGFISVLYFSLFEFYIGATLGMRLFNLSVGGKRTFGKCVLRNIFVLPFFPFTILWFVELFYLFSRNERLLERWSKTSTIEMIKV